MTSVKDFFERKTIVNFRHQTLSGDVSENSRIPDLPVITNFQYTSLFKISIHEHLSMKDENSSRRVNLSEKPSQKILNQSFSQWVKTQAALERCSK